MRLIGIEAAGEGVASGRCAATISEERCNALQVVVEEFWLPWKNTLITDMGVKRVRSKMKLL